MIEWTTVGTVPPLTGVSSRSGSSFSSYNGSVSGQGTDAFNAFVNTGTGSESGSTISSFVEFTSRNHSGATTYQSTTWFQSSTVSWGITNDLTPAAQANPANSYTGQTTDAYTDSSSSSSSFSTQTTTVFTAEVQTSTTATAISGYTVTATTSETGSHWTTSFGDNIEFYTATNSVSVLTTELLTRQSTYLDTTYLAETVTVSALPDTIVQADTLNADQAEIIYAIKSAISDVVSFSAATALADSGTRLTLPPSVSTALKNVFNSTRPTSAIASNEVTSEVVFKNTTTTTEQALGVSFVSFPPQTQTLTRLQTTTTNSTAGVNTLEFQIDHTYGGTTDTVTARTFDTYSTTVAAQIGSLTYERTIQATTTYTVTRTIEADATSSTAPSIYTPRIISIWFGLYTAEAGGSAATIDFSGVTANTFLPTARATIGAGGFPAQIKYGTSGAVVGSVAGQFITANATSEGNASSIYVLGGRSATTVFPITDSKQTIEGNSITWKDGTATTSASFGAAGTPQTIVLSRPISNFGGSAASDETFVQTAAPGVYKNRVDGQTASFDGAATTINDSSEPVSMWFPIKDVRGMALSTDANPIVWTEFRNSVDLPPSLPPLAVGSPFA